MNIDEIENIVDSNFYETNLTDLHYSQAMWEVLSYVESGFSNLYNSNAGVKERTASTDNFINDITYSLRVCHEKCTKGQSRLTRRINDDHISSARELYRKSHDYNLFCSIFPLARKNKINLILKGNEIVTDKVISNGLPYEAYNRFEIKTGADEIKEVNFKKIFQLLNSNYYYDNGYFEVLWSKQLALEVIKEYELVRVPRFHLPDNWAFSKFNLGQFKKVTNAITALSHARYLAIWLNFRGDDRYEYTLRVWVRNRNELIEQLSKYLNIDQTTVSNVIQYLTFGEKDIRTPDIATQPLISLDSNTLAISPSLLLNNDTERNICTLLNQIKEERFIYSSLVENKESILTSQLEDKITSIGLRHASGKLKNTNLDLAIIDDENKVVIGVELKWFIEPAEVREVIDRSKELTKGINQSKIIYSTFRKRNRHLIKDILKVDEDYDYIPVVGSFNWIGFDDIQDELVPIVKIWKLMEVIEAHPNLKDVKSYLENRKYLLEHKKDYEIKDINVHSGELFCKWYGFLGIDSEVLN